MSERAVRATGMAAAVVLIDQWAKGLCDEATPLNYGTVLSGGDGGLALGMRGASVTLLAVGILVAWLWLARRAPWWVLGLVAGGAVSNIMDRAMLGGVRDCIPVVIIWINLADVAIVAGLIGWAMTYQTTEGR